MGLMPPKTKSRDLDVLSQAISEMGGLAEEGLSLALHAIKRRDSATAQTVIDNDRRLDALERRIDEMTVRMLLMHQPMAMDLREIVAGLKIASTLERIGDLSKNIARRAQTLSRMAPLRLSDPVVRMGQLTLRQVTESLDALTLRDEDRAALVWRRDVELDDLYASLFIDFQAAMTRDAAMIPGCTQLMFVAKNLERIGDHATFVAEMTHYVSVGEPLGDNRPKGAPDGSLLFAGQGQP